MMTTKTPRRNRSIGSSCVVVVLLAAGCGGAAEKFVPVEGTVRVRGRPVGANVRVQFLPDYAKGTRGPRSLGVTDAQGRFRLQTDDGREGAVVGHHRIVVEDLERKQARQGEPPPPNASRTPDALASAATSTTAREVKEDGQPIDLDF
jgi:hypothetical protein